VTVIAIRRGERRPALRVRRIVGLLPVGQVAARVAAIVRSNLQIVVVVDVARSAWQIRMAVRQQKSRGAVIEFCSEPAVEIVTALALARSKRRPGACVWRICGPLPIFQMAGIALRRQSVENSRRGPFMALLARHGCMRAEQREAVLVILDLLWRDVPALHRVTLFAVRTHLPAVYVRVAVRAILPYVGEDRLYVALDARHLFVHATERVVRLVMIKLRHRADRTPPRRRVAILAGNRQRPVRTPRGLLVSLGL